MTTPIQIAITVDKYGRRLAYRHSLQAMRYFRMPIEAADLLILTGQAEVVSYRPLAPSNR